MTREEAIAVLKGLSDNPLFSYQHRAAFNIAIHDIKQRHDWDINNLILINKENYEPAEQEPILDKIRAEIESQREEVSKKHSENDELQAFYNGLNDGLKDARDIIDKYKAENEPQESEEQYTAGECTYGDTGCGSCKRQLDCPMNVDKAESEVEDGNNT